NLSNDGTADNFGGSGHVVDTTVLFRDPANFDYRLSGMDGSPATGGGADLSADANLAFTTDVAGLTRTVPWDIGASKMGGPKPIYRSVGPGNAAALSCGVTVGSCTGNGYTMNLSNSVMPFSNANAIPLRVGVGDVITWD